MGKKVPVSLAVSKFSLFSVCLVVCSVSLLLLSSCSSNSNNSNQNSNGLSGYAFFHQGGETIYDVIKQASLPETRSTFVFVLGDNPDFTQKINEEISNLAPLAELVGASKVVSADEQINDKELVVVGTPQTNSLAAKFLSADLVLKNGEALIYLDNSDGFKFFIAGATPQDTAAAVNTLLNFEQNKALLSTNKVLLESNQNNAAAVAGTKTTTNLDTQTTTQTNTRTTAQTATQSDASGSSTQSSGSGSNSVSDYQDDQAYEKDPNQNPDQNIQNSDPSQNPVIENPALQNNQNLAYDGAEKANALTSPGTITLISLLVVLLVLGLIVGFVIYKRKSGILSGSGSSLNQSNFSSLPGTSSYRSSSNVSSSSVGSSNAGSSISTNSDTGKLNFFQKLFKKKADSNMQDYQASQASQKMQSTNMQSVSSNANISEQVKTQKSSQQSRQSNLRNQQSNLQKLDSQKTKELQDYARACSAQGIGVEQIKSSLKGAGWPKDTVDNFFANYQFK